MLVISMPRGYDCHLNITRWSEGTVSISLLISLKLNPADLYKAASRVNSSCTDHWQMKKISTVCLDHQIILTLLIMFSACVCRRIGRRIARRGLKGMPLPFYNKQIKFSIICICLYVYVNIIYTT